MNYDVITRDGEKTENTQKTMFFSAWRYWKSVNGTWKSFKNCIRIIKKISWSTEKKIFLTKLFKKFEKKFWKILKNFFRNFLVRPKFFLNPSVAVEDFLSTSYVFIIIW